jgi:transposase
MKPKELSALVEIRKIYSKEFKEEAVRLADFSGKPISEVARDLGINANMLRRWRHEQHEAGERSFPGQGHRQKGTDLEEENLRLQRELHQVTMERDILKKAVAIFSQNPK